MPRWIGIKSGSVAAVQRRRTSGQDASVSQTRPNKAEHLSKPYVSLAVSPATHGSTNAPSLDDGTELRRRWSRPGGVCRVSGRCLPLTSASSLLPHILLGVLSGLTDAVGILFLEGRAESLCRHSTVQVVNLGVAAGDREQWANGHLQLPCDGYVRR
jgi:hypothetical protein